MKIWQLLLSLTVCALFLPFRAQARESTLPLSRRHAVQPLGQIPQIAVGPTDPTAELAMDRKLGLSTPLRVASPAMVEITPATHGVWEAVLGGRIWRARVSSEGATDLNLGFSRFHLPDGATLHLSSETEDYTQGGFTARDNKPHGQLWTPMIPGDRLVIELFVPDGAAEPELVLSQINCGYRDLFHHEKNLAIAKAGECNNDVICPIGQPWTNEIRSVARYSFSTGFGTFTCSGTLINNVSGDKRNFFLTAAHCVSSGSVAATVVVYWNFQSPICGQHGGGSLAQNQSGAVLRMSKSDVDVTLLELEDVPDLSFQVYYSGWDRSGIAPNGAVGIHHPEGDEKSISFSSSTLTTTTNCTLLATNLTHWQVYWSSGVTEPGSSGSAIWDSATHKIVGTLSGGDALCETPFDSDCYGKLSVAWASGGTAAQRLQNWLDPLNNGPTSISGLDPLLLRTPKIANLTLAGENCNAGVITPGEIVTLNVTLTNQGAASLTNLVVALQPGSGVSVPSPPEVFGLLPTGTNISRTFTFVATGACNVFLGAATRLQLQDGTTDLGTFTNAFSLGGVFAENFDGLTPPLLPMGWTNFHSTNQPWRIIRGFSDTLPNSLFVTNASGVGDVHVTSAPIPINTTNARLSFRHKYSFEIPANYDGGVLEIAIGAGPFMDITNAGSFITNGYTSLISTNFMNPLAGRRAWSGAIPGFITTVAQLPASAAGQNVRFRWRLGSDRSYGAEGWYVDNIFVSDGPACCSPAMAPTIIDLRRLISGLNEAIAFSFASTAGQTYQVEAKDSLSATNWQTLQTIFGDGTIKSFTNDLAQTNRFIRLRSP